jgi:hypothetical protein
MIIVLGSEDRRHPLVHVREQFIWRRSGSGVNGRSMAGLPPTRKVVATQPMRSGGQVNGRPARLGSAQVFTKRGCCGKQTESRPTTLLVRWSEISLRPCFPLLQQPIDLGDEHEDLRGISFDRGEVTQLEPGFSGLRLHETFSKDVSVGKSRIILRQPAPALGENCLKPVP